jgi:hypothetical protein
VSQLTLARNKSLGDRIADFCRTEGTASGPDALARPGDLPQRSISSCENEMSRTPLRKRVCDGGLP